MRILPAPFGAIFKNEVRLNAKRIAPHLSDGQVVFLAPGTFGSWIMARDVKAEVAFAPIFDTIWMAGKAVAEDVVNPVTMLPPK